MLFIMTKNWRQSKAQERRIIVYSCNVILLYLSNKNHVLSLIVSVVRASDSTKWSWLMSAA